MFLYQREIQVEPFGMTLKLCKTFLKKKKVTVLDIIISLPRKKKLHLSSLEEPLNVLCKTTMAFHTRLV